VLGIAFVIFSTVFSLNGIYKITFIPLIEWGLVFLETGIIWLVFRTTNSCCPMHNVAKPLKCCLHGSDKVKENNNSEIQKIEGHKGLKMRVFGSIVTTLLFFAMMAVALVLQLYALNYDLFLTLFTYLTLGLLSPLTFISAGYALNFRNIPQNKRQTEV
jgi:hypothetical protein